MSTLTSLNETQEIFDQAKENNYLDFKEKAKELLAQKVAQKLAEKGYFDKMDQAKGITEGCSKKFEDEEKEEKEEKEEE